MCCNVDEKVFAVDIFVLTFAFAVLYVASMLLKMFVLSAEDLKNFLFTIHYQKINVHL